AAGEAQLAVEDGEPAERGELPVRSEGFGGCQARAQERGQGERDEPKTVAHLVLLARLSGAPVGTRHAASEAHRTPCGRGRPGTGREGAQPTQAGAAGARTDGRA